MSKLPEFERRLIELCKEYDARIFARTDGKQPMVSVVFGEQEIPWIDYKRINATEGIVKTRRKP